MVAGSVGEVAALAFPAVLHTLSDTLMQVVDAAIVGRLGVTELAAVGFAGIWIWTLICFFVGSATGVQTFVAQEYGARQWQQCGAWVWHGLYAMLPIVLLWTLILAATVQPLLGMLGSDADMLRLAGDFGRSRLWGLPAIAATVVLTSYFRGLGDTRTPLVIAVIADLIDTALSYGLVFGRFGLPEWGVFGAGAATSLGNWFAAGMMLFAFLRPGMRRYGTRPVRPDAIATRRFVRTSAPVGGQWVLEMVSFAVFSTIIARMGAAPMAASQAMILLLSLSFMQAYGISIASGALVGRYIGAHDLDAAARSHRSALRLGLLLAALVATLFLTIPDALLRIFSNDQEVLALGRPLLGLGAFFQLIDAVGIIVGGSLRGAGDTRWPFLVHASLAWALRLPLVYLLAVRLDGGVTGAWAAELAYIAVLAVAFLLRFRTGAWQRIRI